MHALALAASEFLVHFSTATPEKRDLVVRANKMGRENVGSRDSLVTVPMAGGDSPYSYANNSTYQRGGVDLVKILINEEIAKKLDLKQILGSSSVFNIADLGCSIGPNTFLAIGCIIDAVESNRKSEGRSSASIEYQVYFNDHATNDFNTLFGSMPRERLYFAAGVPGNFYERIFPMASLHFVNCSYAVNWLSKAPEPGSKRSICVGNKEVKEYRDQFANDMELFLNHRAEEMVPGGFVALLITGIPRGADPEKFELMACFNILASCLADMAETGIVEEAKVDSFRMPLHWPSPEELEEIAGRSSYFKIERIEQSTRPMPPPAREIVHAKALALRSSIGQFITENFGNDIVDELFNRYEAKLLKFYLAEDPSIIPVSDLFILLQRVNVD